jgi:hypothetical protein
MKNSRFRPLNNFGIDTGPLTVKPNWFHLNGSFGGRAEVNA